MIKTTAPKGPRRITKKYFCSIEVAVDCIGGKWKPTIMYYLKDRPTRFTELCKLIPRVSKKVLAAQLRELESDGLITRKVLDDEVPKGMEYSLTKSSRDELMPILQSLHEWGVRQAQRKNLILELPVSNQEN